MAKIFTESNDIDEFNLAFEHDEHIHNSSSKRPHKKKHYTNSKKHTYLVQSQYAGVDARGVPQRVFMGAVRPYYSRLTTKVKDMFRNELKTDIAAIIHAHPWVNKTLTDIPEDLDVLHSLKENLLGLAQASAGAVTYKQMIIGASGSFEFIASIIGLKNIKGFTETQIETLPLYETMIMKIATKNRGGPTTQFPAEMQLGIMVFASVGFYVGINYFISDKKSAKGLFKKVGKIINNMSDHYNKSTANAVPNRAAANVNTQDDDIELEEDDIPDNRPPPPGPPPMGNMFSDILGNIGPILGSITSAMQGASGSGEKASVSISKGSKFKTRRNNRRVRPARQPSVIVEEVDDE